MGNSSHKFILIVTSIICFVVNNFSLSLLGLVPKSLLPSLVATSPSLLLSLFIHCIHGSPRVYTSQHVRREFYT